MTDQCQMDKSDNYKKRPTQHSIEITPSSTKHCKVNEGQNVSTSSKVVLLANKEVAGKTNSNEKESCFNVCEALNLKDGDRLEVLWCIASPDVEDENFGENTATTATKEATTTTEKRWWGATLLPIEDPTRHFTFSYEEEEEKTEELKPYESGVAVPIRLLHYDPYIEGGFLESSLNDVAFISDRLVYDIELKDHLAFRREGSTWEPSDEDLTEKQTPYTDTEAAYSSSNTRDSLLPVLEGVLSIVLAKFQPKMALLSAERQHWIADCVAQAKERLADRIMVEMGKTDSNVVTADLVKICMEEVGKELSLKGIS